MPFRLAQTAAAPVVPWQPLWRPGTTGWDEVGSPEPRAPWRQLDGAQELGDLASLEHCHDEARRLIRDLGVSYTVYGKGEDQRPWAFDPLPLMLDAEEWADLEAGLVQRARLMEAILGDLYGDQRLLRERVVPPGLLFANPWFQRTATGIHPPGGRWLHLYAVDLVRGPDGQWLALADRTQAPSGMGYALANRFVSVRAAPQTVAQVRPAAILGWFERLGRLAADLTQVDEPTVAVLSPGPYNETYFEHAFLARQLGFVLARGQDLLVRDETLFLDTLGGLRRIHVLLRRVDDDFCDPLELRGDSQLGVAGLAQAARAGRVVLANPIGSGVVEALALHPYLPRLARMLLGEDLSLPTVDTVWGPDALCARLTDAPESVLFKPAFANPGIGAMLPERLSDEARERLAEELRLKPHSLVAQSRVPHSVVPVLTPSGIEARPIQLRCFLLRDGEGWWTMPGGLVRFGVRGDDLPISMQAGGGAKDAWLVGSGAPPAVARPPAPVVIRRSTEDLPSRVADNLFWTGRYVERADNALRIARAALARLSEADRQRERAPLLTALARSGMPLSSATPLASLAQVMTTRHPGTFGASLSALGRVTFDLSDRLSPDLGRLLSTLGQDADEPVRGTAALGDRIDRWLESMAAIQGLMGENLVRGIGWRFLEVGRRLERAMVASDSVATLVAPGQPLDAGLTATLEVCDSQLTYRWRYPAGLTLPAVIDLVVLDDSNPRSILYQLEAIERQLAALPGAERDGRPSPARRLLASRTAALMALAVETSTQQTAVETLSAVWRDLSQISDRLTERYFRPGAGAAA
ncbi:MAG: hypothetical protein EAZ99_09365 [Alphaproteobacteria bacterium]|nr:circularly permuted type 2 ATP-grasp protein [Alphaproteobacteria bacterium]TAD89588.1 MAG: hypothetical protein EAZ99_09365 [Alphaproteobacteria bacterium]